MKNSLAGLVDGPLRGRMYRFEVREDGRRRSGVIRADNRQTAIAALTERRWILLHLDEYQPPKPAVSSGNPREAAGFFRQLAVMYRSGVHLTDGLQVLLKQAHRSSRPLLREMLVRLLAGGRISQAMRACPSLIPTWCVPAVAAAEVSGTMASTLDRLAATLEHAQALRHRIRQALTYPAWVLGLGLLLNLALARSLVPAFSRAFQQAEVPVPAFTRAVLSATGALGDPRTWLLVTCLVGLAWLGLRWEGLQAWLDRWPMVGPLRLKGGRIAALQTLATLLEAGVPLQNALTVTAQAATAPTLLADLEAIHLEVLEGSPLSEALERHGFSPMASQFARAAEESGGYPDLLRRVAESEQEALDLALETTTRLLEPILVGLLGLVIGTVSIAFFLPLYSAAASW
jgi:type II secretory pathway component PulF